MFDVSWSDPTKQTIGERRSRKEQNGGSTRKPNGLSRRSSMKSSRSSESATKPSLLNLFGSSKKPELDRARSQFKLSGLHPEDAKDRRVSNYTIGSESSAQESSGTTTKTRIPSNAFSEGRNSHSDAEQSFLSEPPESVFSGWTRKSCRSDSIWSSVIDSSIPSSSASNQIVQPLLPTSFVTQTTGVTVSPRDSIKVEEQVATVVHITAAGTMPVQLQDIPDSPSKKPSPPSTFAFPLPLSHAHLPATISPTTSDPSHKSVGSEGKLKTVIKKEPSISPVSILLPTSSSSSSKTQPKRWPTHSSSRSRLREVPSPIVEIWRPPETWECPAFSSDPSCSPATASNTPTQSRTRVHRSPPSPPPALSTLPSLPRRSKDRNGSTLKPRQKSKSSATSTEILHLQRTMRRMAAASKKTMLERLREEWTEVADASVYRELELEKQMWMLTVLRSFESRRGIDVLKNGTSAPNRHNEERGREDNGGIMGTKVLSLFENHASASSLLALMPPGTELHHLSTAPLSPKQYPNVHPLTVPSATPHLPYASNLFSSIHAFCLPSLLPASSIPTILKDCHRILLSPPPPPSPDPPGLSAPLSANSSESTITPSKPTSDAPKTRGGILHLTILDPSPRPGTLGPRLQAWLDEHLVLNLEKQFRCINPSRLFPDWLADAGLRAEGSTVAYMKFYASVPRIAWSGSSSSPASRGGEEDGDQDPTAGEELEREIQREKEMEDDHVKQELKSAVGRMLWKEMWGYFVQGEKWWWEDKHVLDECERLGTVWEYAVIEAVKV